MKFKNILLATILSIVTSIAFGEEQTPEVTVKDLTGRADFSIPQSPAFTVLGVTPDNVIHPTSYRSLATSFLEGVDQSGNIQSGFAVDTKPYFLAKGKEISLRDYRSKRTIRQLSRMQLSFATSSSEGSSKADRYGVSLRWTPWDPADPRMSTALDECRRESLVSEDDAETVFGDITALSEDEVKKLRSKDKKCRVDAKKQEWNAGSWDLGIAGFSTTLDSGTASGHALWSSIALKFRDSGQFIFHARHTDNELTAVEGETGLSFNPVNRTTIGGRFKYGNSRGALLLEAVRVKEEGANDSDIEGTRYLLGTEFRVREGMWIQLAVGDADGELADNSDVYYSGQFRWAFAEKSLLK